MAECLFNQYSFFFDRYFNRIYSYQRRKKGTNIAIYEGTDNDCSVDVDICIYYS
ncbi:hypothetical protein OSO01_07350 [Oceanobacillus sojae]|uniref:Uncharacterized protein n=1 Tax=Oceanobacillus sojae TaxID=582851 RepID=A0A511ZEX8_9BACI|nr:hypothetical protein OSO01_07350 [Oceanobacillus sojae]